MALSVPYTPGGGATAPDLHTMCEHDFKGKGIFFWALGTDPQGPLVRGAFQAILEGKGNILRPFYCL